MCFTTIGQKEVFAQDINTNKINIVHDGKNYRVEPEIKENENTVITKIFTDEKLTDVVVYNMKTGKVIDNGKEIGFVNEVPEEAPTLSKIVSKLKNTDTSVTPNVVTPLGDGGGDKIYLRSYSTGFSSTSYTVVLGVVTSIIATVAYLLSVKYDNKVSLVTVIVAISTLLNSCLTLLIPNHTYYLKAYYCGVLNGYVRTLTDYYSDSSYDWTKYTGCVWGNQYVQPY